MSEFLALVVVFTLRPLIRLACGEPPSPSGEGFGAGELGRYSDKPTWAAGAASALRTDALFFQNY